MIMEGLRAIMNQLPVFKRTQPNVFDTEMDCIIANQLAIIEASDAFKKRFGFGMWVMANPRQRQLWYEGQWYEKNDWSKSVQPPEGSKIPSSDAVLTNPNNRAIWGGPFDVPNPTPSPLSPEEIAKTLQEIVGRAELTGQGYGTQAPDTKGGPTNLFGTNLTPEQLAEAQAILNGANEISKRKEEEDKKKHDKDMKDPFKRCVAEAGDNVFEQFKCGFKEGLGMWPRMTIESLQENIANPFNNLTGDLLSNPIVLVFGAAMLYSLVKK